MKRGYFVFALGLFGAFGLAMATPTPAEACGGTFCDAGPQPMPVDQSGENILFVRDGDYIEAHIQIQYEGAAEEFGWVIPLQSLPEFSVGSDQLFQGLLGGTVPTYTVQTVRDDCAVGGGDEGGSPEDNGASTGAAGDESGEGGEDPGTQVVLEETVGAFDIVVLAGGTAAEVIEWLAANEYEQNPQAEAILQAYLDEGHLFGAIKLTGGADVDEIHPITLRFLGTEPCIPLRLTRIAAVDDMEIRSFFLGDARTVPRNYKHVLINQVKIDWTPGNLAANYKEIITQAVDAEMARGRAFVTEYAGTSNVVPRGGIHSNSWDSAAFETLEAVDVIDVLTGQGLYFCDFDFGNGCGPQHPLVQPLLDEYLPVPEGVEPEAFYECLDCYADEIDLMAWNGPAFAAGLEDRVVAPGLHATALLDDNDYLTRMYTTISPGEMSEDPMFHENAELPEISNQYTGTQRVLCNGDSVYILPDGREVYLAAGAPWPDFDGEPAWSMPSDEEVQEVMSAGAPVVLVNNTQSIDDALASYNLAQGWSGAEGSGSGSTSGADAASGGGGGCDCRSGSRDGIGGLMIMLLGLGLGFASRRRSAA